MKTCINKGIPELSSTGGQWGKEQMTSVDIDLGCGRAVGSRLVSVFVYILGICKNVGSVIL